MVSMLQSHARQIVEPIGPAVRLLVRDERLEAFFKNCILFYALLDCSTYQ